MSDDKYELYVSLYDYRKEYKFRLLNDDYIMVIERECEPNRATEIIKITEELLKEHNITEYKTDIQQIKFKKNGCIIAKYRFNHIYPKCNIIRPFNATIIWDYDGNINHFV